jgi:hypothetical protein
MAGNHDQKRNSNLPPDEASSNPHCFCYCRRAVDNTIIAYLVCCGNFVLRPFQVNIVVMSPHHSGIILFALLGCVDLLRSIDRAQFAVIGFVSNQNVYKLWPSIVRD